MDLKEICANLNGSLIELFDEVRSGLIAREDSRAFGAMVEHRIEATWPAICSRHGYAALTRPGRRTIFDFAFTAGDVTVGLDVKTKDLDSAKYSDGGICAVGNLLKFLANDRGIFLIAEFGHNQAASTSEARDIEYIKVAPFTQLPSTAYRIENLGTGQVRLNYSINQIWEEIDWDADANVFYEHFTDLAILHYERVGRDAQKRADAMRKFRADGFSRFQFAR